MPWSTRWRSFLSSEGRVFDSRWCRRNFSLTQFCRPQYVRGVGSASNRNEYQEYFVGSRRGRCVGLTSLAYSCGDCLEVWESQHPGTIRACPGITLSFSRIISGTVPLISTRVIVNFLLISNIQRCRLCVCPTYLWQTATAFIFGRLAGRTWKTSNK
jgi:hypothetical protein